MEAESTHESDVGTHVVPSIYLTSAWPAIGGSLKERPEDFLVEEIPAYEPSGEGEHIYLFVEKRGLSTLELVEILARHFGVPRGAIGYAGLKDKQALTRQVVSIHVPGRKIEDFAMIEHPRIGVLWSDYHANKLRIGHLRGNRFSIKIRGVKPTDALTALRVMRELERTGVPNRIGEQRFGYMGNNHLVGRAIIKGEAQAALDLLLGPSPRQPAEQAEAREAYARGDFARALNLMPRSMRTEQDALHALVRGATPDRAIRAIGRTVAEYYLTAFQSSIFNAVLDARLREGTLGTLLVGDVAQKHENLACFDVDEAVAADPATTGRLAAFEISPSGPMWGPAMKRAAGRTDERELAALAAAGLTPADLDAFASGARLTFQGARRPLRVPVTDPVVEGGVDEFGAFVRCAFELPRGAFATVVMREVMKPELVGGRGAAEEE